MCLRSWVPGRRAGQRIIGQPLTLQPRVSKLPPIPNPNPGAPQIVRARRAGQRVIGETLTSGLALNESWMWHPDFDVAARYVMSPPIRSEEHRFALKQASGGRGI